MAWLDPAVAGDVNVTRARTLTEFGTLEDGTGEDDVAAVVAHIWRGNTDPVELACSVSDAADCSFVIDFGDETGWLATEAVAGVWLVEYQATFDDDTVLTAPGVWPDQIVIRANHAPEVEP